MEGQQEQFVQGPQQEGTLYQRVGGIPYFTSLVERFYERVEADPVLRPLYPDDLEPGKHNLAMFLVQLWGGPPYYAMERGRPLLRMRHMPFAIGQAERDAWFGHMSACVLESGVDREDATMLIDYFEKASQFMINKD
ncbi:MAG: globin [Chloroflexota bacterium]|nr:globin [Chloroflexota bacterium]